MIDIEKNLKEFFSEKGQCYKNAWNWSQEYEEWKLVHGLVWNPLSCDYMGHAWCEKEELVLDPTHKIILPKYYFYAMGKVKYTKSYTKKVSWNNAIKYMIYGAWDSKISKGLHNLD